MVNKKGQMKIQQMAFMLMAVTLFFALVGMFLLTILASNLKESSANLEEQNALLLVSRLANSPEFSCGNAFGTTRLNCIDFDKTMALKETAGKYSQTNFWGVSGIEIVKIYPANTVTCTNENYPNCGKLEILTPKNGGTGVSNFVALCRKQRIVENVFDEEGNIIGSPTKIVDICELAKVIVTYTEK